MRVCTIILMMVCSISCTPTSKSSNETNLSSDSHPKLVVGIVIDQMRYDYLTRFESKYGQDGFKRIIKQGFNCKEQHFSYMPTKTGPGHASIFTGTTPSVNGIIANDWFNKSSNELIYCVEDHDVESVGGDFVSEKRSPKNLLVSTLSDQIKKESGGKSIGISIKDRGAVLPAGKNADAAYWFVGEDDGLFISSTYYMKSLPSWVNDFNSKQIPDSYLSQNWETLLPMEQYVESNPDQSKYEHSIDTASPPVFPYNLLKIKETEGVGLIKTTPFGNDLILDFTKAAIEGENLGQDDKMDWLSISFSSTDYIGHEYGPNSVEIEDTYIRLDLTLAKLLNYLDTEVGEGEYLLFLTADHGVAPIPHELMENGENAGYYSNADIKQEIDAVLLFKYGQPRTSSNNFVLSFSNSQFFLNHELLKELGISSDSICNTISDVVIKMPGVNSVYLKSDLERGIAQGAEAKKVLNGWNKERSGDVMLVMNNGWISDYYKTIGGTGHGSLWNYDTHVPLLFYGYGITPGYTNENTYVQDIVPTVSSVIGLTVPKFVTGTVINDVVK